MATAAVTTALCGTVGAALAVVAIARAQLPTLETGERLVLLVRSFAIGASTGLVAGIAAGLVAAVVARSWLRRSVIIVLVGGLVGAAVVAGARRPFSPWSSVDAAREYPPPPAPQPAARAPNIVLVTFDTLRADHLEAYGYHRSTAPHLAALARDGTVFETVIAQAPETLHSVASLLTGLDPHVLDREYEERKRRGAFLGDAFHTVAERLAARGYDTAAFVSNVYLRQRNGFGAGFRHFDDRSGMFYAGAGRTKRAEHVVTPALEWLDRVRSPFFLWIHVMDPHHPYEPPVAGPWERAAPVHATAYERLSLDDYTQRLKDLRADRRRAADGEIAYLVGRYDAEILHADRELAVLWQRLAARDDTVIAVTADHGEEFGDHGQMLHGHTLFDELLRVPLIVRGPGIPRGRRVGGQVRLVDVVPTLLDLAGDVGSDGLDGETLLPALAGESPAIRPAVSFLQTRYVAYRTPEWKLVVAFTPYDASPPSWLPWDGLVTVSHVALGRPHRPKIGLWHLGTDPAERRNVASDEPATLRALYATLLEHRRAHPPRVVVSTATLGLDGRARETLRALGYVE